MNRMHVICRLVVVAAWAGGAVACATASMASPVIDDEALGGVFVEKLGRLAEAEETLDGVTIGKRATAVQGGSVTLPASAARHAIVAKGPVYDAVLPAVVALGFTYKCEHCTNWHIELAGTGWIASPDGLVVTAHHCVQWPKESAAAWLGVMTSDGEVFAVTDVAAVDVDGDAAVLRIDTRGRELPCLALGQPPACGEAVTMIGHPACETLGGVRPKFFCLSDGVVSRYSRSPRIDDSTGPLGEPRVWLNVTADTGVGSSGGPVFDSSGHVVGMASRMGPSFGLPASTNGNVPAAQTEPGRLVTMWFRECASLDTLRPMLGAAEPANAVEKPGR